MQERVPLSGKSHSEAHELSFLGEQTKRSHAEVRPRGGQSPRWVIWSLKPPTPDPGPGAPSEELVWEHGPGWEADSFPKCHVAFLSFSPTILQLGKATAIKADKELIPPEKWELPGTVLTVLEQPLALSSTHPSFNGSFPHSQRPGTKGGTVTSNTRDVLHEDAQSQRDNTGMWGTSKTGQIPPHSPDPQEDWSLFHRDEGG